MDLFWDATNQSGKDKGRLMRALGLSRRMDGAAFRGRRVLTGLGYYISRDSTASTKFSLSAHSLLTLAIPYLCIAFVR